MLRHFRIAPGTRRAHAFTHLDFEAAAHRFGAAGGFAHLATLVKQVRAERPGALPAIFCLLRTGRSCSGGSRTLYNLGREYLYRDRAADAIAVVERCLAEYPGTYDCHMARGSIHLHQEEPRQAIPHFIRAIELRAESGTARHHLGVALENLGCEDEARAQYRLAARSWGFGAPTHRLGRLDDPGSGLLAPAKPQAAHGSV